MMDKRSSMTTLPHSDTNHQSCMSLSNAPCHDPLLEALTPSPFWIIIASFYTYIKITMLILILPS